MVATNANNFAIDLHHVEKRYKGRVHALRGVTMQVHPGEIFGLLGPNGAGKSTLVKIMTTVVRPTRADGTVLGKPVGHKATLARVGYLPEHHRFPKYLTGAQVLDFYGAMANVDRRERKERASHLLGVVGMSDWKKKRIGQYSKGMMQRIGLAQALMNDPDLVILDEPTDGVDPVGRREIRDVLVRLRDQGKTVFLNSHLLSELEMVCNRVAIMVQGQVRQQGTIDELTKESQRYEVVIKGSPPASLRPQDGLRVEQMPNERSKLVLMGAQPEPVQPILDQLRSAGATILSVQPVRESLEDLFMRAIIDPETGQELKPGAGAAMRKGAK